MIVFAIGWLCQPIDAAEGDEGLRVATFVVDVTPPLGSPLCYGYVKPAAEVVDPLTARGVVLLGSGKPIVLCVADFVGIGNASHDLWRAALAEAAGTTADRVAMHSVHNHDSPGYDKSTDQLLEGQGLGGKLVDRKAHDESIDEVAAALSWYASHPQSYYGRGGISADTVGYIGTAVAYEQGGYEVSRVSRTGPTVEEALLGATKELLKRE